MHSKMVETEEKVEERLVLRRVPPGDRWETVEEERQFSNLTSALDYIFKTTGQYDFSVYARKGEVCIKNIKKVVKEATKYSLYGED